MSEYPVMARVDFPKTTPPTAETNSTRPPNGPVLAKTEELVREFLKLGSSEHERLIAHGGQLIEALLQTRGASDIQIRTDRHPRVHVGGELVIIGPENQRLSSYHVYGIVLALWRSRTGAHTDDSSEQNFSKADEVFGQKLEQEKVVDFACEGGDLLSTVIQHPSRMRVQAFLEQNGVACTIRILREVIPSLESLNFDDATLKTMRAAVSRRSGLCLVTGQTGAGKSTTLAALIQWLRAATHRHIVTIEQPIEFRYPDTDDSGKPFASLITQQEVGLHVGSFRAGLETALRKAPHGILIGEIRDGTTMSTALEAAETGHIVFATLHTRTAPETISRITSFFPPDRQEGILTQLKDSLLFVLSQGLLPRKNGDGRVLCYEFFCNNEQATRSAIGGYLQNSTTLNGMLMRSGNIAWDSALEQLHREGVVSDETLETNRIQQIHQNES